MTGFDEASWKAASVATMRSASRSNPASSGADLALLLYVATGVGASIAGILAASNLQATNSGSLGEKREFYTLIVVLLGGVAWAGGRGKLSGVAVAVIFIATLFHGLTLLDVNSFVQDLILGSALVIAALVDALLVALPGRVRMRRQVATQVAAAPPPDARPE